MAGDGTSKSAASRRFVALSAARLAEWMASDLSALDLLVIQIDGLHIGNDLVLVAALGIDAEGHKHPLGLVERATENASVVQALIDNLIERGLDPTVCRLFIIDGTKALSKVQPIKPSPSPNTLKTVPMPHSIIHGNACLAYFNKIRGIPVCSFCVALRGAMYRCSAVLLSSVSGL